MNTSIAGTFLLLIICTSGFAQISFSPGYIVRRDGDTLKGEVRQRSNQLIYFRAKSDASAQSYKPDEVISYQIDGVNHAALSLREDGKTTLYFMQEQVKGYVSLYSLFQAESRLTHVMQLPNKTVVPLRGNLALLQMTTHLTECKSPQVARLLKAQSFYNSGFNFERVVKAYNQCMRPAESYERPKKRFRYEVGLSGILLHNGWLYGKKEDNPSSPGYYPYYDPYKAYSTFNTATVGAFITVLPRKRFSTGVEFLASKYKGNLSVPLTDPLDPAARNTRYYSFEEHYLVLPITGRYMFIDKRLRCYLKAGIVPTLRTATSSSFTDDVSAKGSLLLHDVNVGIGYLAGAGVDIPLTKKRSLYIEFRTMPHLVLDGVTKIGTSRSMQFAVSVPLIRRD